MFDQANGGDREIARQGGFFNNCYYCCWTNLICAHVEVDYSR